MTNSTDYMFPNRDISLIHPFWACALWRLIQDIEEAWDLGKLKRHWRVFEGYRHPDRQDHLLRSGTTKASAYQSPHQFGLGADFAVWSDKTRNWSWPETSISLPDGTTEKPYEELHVLARKHGIVFPISWDPGHSQPASVDWSQIVPRL